MENVQYIFLKTLCDLCDGEHFVPETTIRAVWPECPPHDAILPLGNGDYFEYNYNMSSPGYMPTAHGLAFVTESREHSNEELRRIAVACEKHAKIAELEAAEAKIEAKQALRRARISNVIAGIAALITLLSWLFPSEAIPELIKAIISKP